MRRKHTCDYYALEEEYCPIEQPKDMNLKVTLTENGIIIKKGEENDI